MRNEVNDYQHEPESETEVLYDKNPERRHIVPLGRGRLRTAEEARQQLEELRRLYQSLTPQEQCGVKSFMSDLWKSQHQVTKT